MAVIQIVFFTGHSAGRTFKELNADPQYFAAVGNDKPPRSVILMMLWPRYG